MIVVNATFQAKPEYRQTMIDMASTLIGPSSAEAGCILYSFLEDANQAARFVFFEKWQSRKDLDEHFQTPYYLSFAEKFPDIVIGDAVIEVHEVASTDIVR